MALLGQFLRVPRNFEISRIDLGPGPRDDIAALTLLKISAIGLKFSGMMHSAMKQMAI